MLVRPLGHRAVCGFAPLARNPLLSVSSVILLGTAELARSEECWSQLAGNEPQLQFRPTALLKQISEGVNGSSLSFCCRLHSPWFCFSAALFVVAPFADLTSRNHFCQFTAIFLAILRSRFWDRQAVRIFGPQPLTPIVRWSTASPGHVIHFAVQPEYGRLIGIFPCSQKVEITLRRNTLHLSRFWLQTFRVA